MNGFQTMDIMFNHGEEDVGIGILCGLLSILMFISTIVGIIIGILLLINKNINIIIDWITSDICIASGLIVYFGCLQDDGTKLLSGAYLILIGWVIALGGQIISTALSNPRALKVIVGHVGCIVAAVLIAFYPVYMKSSDEAIKDRLIKEVDKFRDIDDGAPKIQWETP
jgi:hypothetical protein